MLVSFNLMTVKRNSWRVPRKRENELFQYLRERGYNILDGGLDVFADSYVFPESDDVGVGYTRNVGSKRRLTFYLDRKARSPFIDKELAKLRNYMNEFMELGKAPESTD